LITPGRPMTAKCFRTGIGALGHNLVEVGKRRYVPGRWVTESPGHMGYRFGGMEICVTSGNGNTVKVWTEWTEWTWWTWWTVWTAWT
jgi:hypothetical protein